MMGYRHEPAKFTHAELTPLASDLVQPPRAAECRVRLEAVLARSHGLAEGDTERRGNFVALEARAVRVHVDETILLAGHARNVR
ncbi:MAG: hypothetical protein ABI637_00350 [Gemmatimonadota bacterium]